MFYAFRRVHFNHIHRSPLPPAPPDLTLPPPPPPLLRGAKLFCCCPWFRSPGCSFLQLPVRYLSRPARHQSREEYRTDKLASPLEEELAHHHVGRTRRHAVGGASGPRQSNPQSICKDDTSHPCITETVSDWRRVHVRYCRGAFKVACLASTQKGAASLRKHPHVVTVATNPRPESRVLNSTVCVTSRRFQQGTVQLKWFELIDIHAVNQWKRSSRQSFMLAPLDLTRATGKGNSNTLSPRLLTPAASTISACCASGVDNKSIDYPGS